MKLFFLYFFTLQVTLQSTLALPGVCSGRPGTEACRAACCGEEEENTETGEPGSSRPCNPFQCHSCCPAMPGGFCFSLLPPSGSGTGPEPARTPSYCFDLHSVFWHPPRPGA